MFEVKSASFRCLLSLYFFVVAQVAVAADNQAVEAINQALMECNLAQKERVAKQPIQAQRHIQRFTKQKNLALSIDAAAANNDGIAEQIRRCDRLSAIVERSNQAYEQQQAAINNVVEESHLYVRECKLGLQILESNSVDERSLRSAEDALLRAEEHKTILQGEWRAFAAFRKNPQHTSKVALAVNLEKGDACMASADELRSTRRHELEKIGKKLEPLSARAGASRQICNQAMIKTTRSPTEANLQDARALLLRAQAQEQELRSQLRGNKTVNAHSDSLQVKRLNSEFASVTECISKAEAAVDGMANAVLKQNRQLAKEKAERLAQERAQAAPSEMQIAGAKKEASLQDEMLRVEAEAEAKAKAEAARLAKERAQKARASPWRR